MNASTWVLTLTDGEQWSNPIPSDRLWLRALPDVGSEIAVPTAGGVLVRAKVEQVELGEPARIWARELRAE